MKAAQIGLPLRGMLVEGTLAIEEVDELQDDARAALQAAEGGDPRSTLVASPETNSNRQH